MTKIAVRQTILGSLVVLNLSLLASCIYLLRSEMTAAILFCFAFLGSALTLVVCGVYFTTGSRDTMPFRMVMVMRSKSTSVNLSFTASEIRNPAE